MTTTSSPWSKDASSTVTLPPRRHRLGAASTTAAGHDIAAGWDTWPVGV